MKKYVILFFWGFCIALLAEDTSFAAMDNLYRQFVVHKEKKDLPTGWTIYKVYDADNKSLPRVLVIGDSIVGGYQEKLKKKLDGKMTMTVWTTSDCVTYEYFIRELSVILGLAKSDVICFNNGCHSFLTPLKDYENAYRRVVDYLISTRPKAKIFLTLTTPNRELHVTKKFNELNQIVINIAKEKNLEVIDLFAPMDKLDRREYWKDNYHFKDNAQQIQTEIITEKLTPFFKR